MVITNVETCVEVPDSQDDEDEQNPTREVKVKKENFVTSQLCVSPEVPPASVLKRVTLTKKATSSADNILRNKNSKDGKPPSSQPQVQKKKNSSAVKERWVTRKDLNKKSRKK